MITFITFHKRKPHINGQFSKYRSKNVFQRKTKPSNNTVQLQKITAYYPQDPKRVHTKFIAENINLLDSM